MPALLIGLGVIGIVWGGASYLGLLPTVQRRGLTGGVHPDLVLMGFGLILIGVGLSISSRVLGFVGITLVVLGGLLWVTNPSWLEPAWYRRRFPRK